jgi:hypothetical protein
MSNLNGGFYDYANRTTSRLRSRADDFETKTGVVLSGQVLKAHTWLQTDGTGKLIAHTGLAEGSIVDFTGTLTTGQTLILGGLTFTAGTGSVTPAQLAVIWAGLSAGIGYVAAAAQILAAGIDATVTGTFTAGTFSTWNTFSRSTTSVMFTSTATLTNATDLAATGTGTATTISKVDGTTSFAKVAGLTLYDVDATAGDVSVEVWEEGAFWADQLVWANDPTVDTITKFDGTTVACTAYNTGVYGIDATSTMLLQLKFVEGSEFDLDFLHAGEIANG